MSSDAANGKVNPPLDDVPPSAAAEDAEFEGDLWNDELSDAFGDAGTTNWFSAEIENVSASDWDVDTAQIWGGDDVVDGVTDDGGAAGMDFSM